MDLTKIPDDLKQLPQWVLWKMADIGHGLTKVPFQATGKTAKPNDPQTWSTFATVEQSVDGYEGPGFMFSHYDEFVGVDLDGCRNPEDGKFAEWARTIIQELNSYTEISPSGTGVKIWVRGKSPFETGKAKNLDEPKVSYKEPGIEIYDKLRYFAVTGQRVAGVSAEVEERDLGWLKQLYWPSPKLTEPSNRPTTSAIARARAYIAKAEGAVAGEKGHNTTFAVACVLVIGFDLTEGDAMMLLKEYNQTCQPPWSEHELEHKIKSAAGQPGERGELLSARSDWQPPKANGTPYTPNQSESAASEDVEPEPKEVRTLQDAANACIDKYRSGDMTFVRTGIPDLDDALGGGVYQGEVVVIAARPSHGKTCVALQWIHNLNAKDFPTLFINLDMAEHLLGKRVIHYASGITPANWKENTDVDTDIEMHFEKRSRCEVESECFEASECVAIMQKSVERNQTKIVFIDYIQLLGADGKDDFHRVSTAFKIICREARRLKLTLVALCQMNRNVEGRKTFVPVMSDLKSAGQLEQDTDVILFPVYPHRHEPENPKEEFMIHIGKNRNKETNNTVVKFKFNAARQTLEMESPNEKAQACDNYVPGFDEWAK